MGRGEDNSAADMPTMFHLVLTHEITAIVHAEFRNLLAHVFSPPRMRYEAMINPAPIEC